MASSRITSFRTPMADRERREIPASRPSATHQPLKEGSDMKQPLDRSGWMQRVAVALSRAGSRISTTVQAWRERRVLERELAQLHAHGEYDRVLADNGLSSSDVPRLLHAHPGAARQLADMMSRLGVDRRRLVVTPAVAGELRDIEWRCGECRSWRQCRAWLDAGEVPERYRSFCPNTAALDRLRDRQRTAVGKSRSGVLAELRCAGPDLR
jgi:hypothetical protein